jgi:hypothetical protein
MNLPLRRRVLALCAVMALSACATAPTTGVPGAPQRIAFIDSDGFDRQVQGAIGSGVESVDIAMLAPAPVNSLPPRLSKVLSTVQETGGKVSVQSGSRGGTAGGTERSLFTLLSLLPALMDAVQDARVRQAYRDYDASVTLVEGQVTRVQLIRR